MKKAFLRCITSGSPGAKLSRPDARGPPPTNRRLWGPIRPRPPPQGSDRSGRSLRPTFTAARHRLGPAAAPLTPLPADILPPPRGQRGPEGGGLPPAQPPRGLEGWARGEPPGSYRPQGQAHAAAAAAAAAAAVPEARRAAAGRAAPHRSAPPVPPHGPAALPSPWKRGTTPAPANPRLPGHSAAA